MEMEEEGENLTLTEKGETRQYIQIQRKGEKYTNFEKKIFLFY